MVYDLTITSQRIRNVFREDLLHILGEVDAMVTPATPAPAPKGLSYTGSPVFNVPFTNAGVPTLTLPIGLAGASRLPIGLQLASGPLKEAELIRIGHAFQSETNWQRVRPKLP